MSPASLISALQSDALVREIEQQLKQESDAVSEGAQRDARNILAQARSAARSLVQVAIDKLREEGTHRLTRARAQLDTAARGRAQQQAAQAVRDALPLLREALAARWCEPESRKQWCEAVARLAAARLPPGAWRIAHPHDWSQADQKHFIATAGGDLNAAFDAADIDAGLRISADQAVLDATPQGLLADATTIAAMLLDEIGAGS